MKFVACLLLLLTVGLLTPIAARAVDNPCPRPGDGSMVSDPPELRSRNGLLRLALHYQTATDAFGRTLYCFMTPDGKQSPTLRVRPGDRVVIDLTNDLPGAARAHSMSMTSGIGQCGDEFMTPSSV